MKKKSPTKGAQRLPSRRESLPLLSATRKGCKGINQFLIVVLNGQWRHPALLALTRFGDWPKKRG